MLFVKPVKEMELSYSNSKRVSQWFQIERR